MAARAWLTAVVVAGLLEACARGPAPLVRYEDPLLQVALDHPQGWQVLRSGDGRWLQVVPNRESPEPDPLRYTEFLSVRLLSGPPPAHDDPLRQEAFSQLPFTGWPSSSGCRTRARFATGSKGQAAPWPVSGSRWASFSCSRTGGSTWCAPNHWTAGGKDSGSATGWWSGCSPWEAPVRYRTTQVPFIPAS